MEKMLREKDGDMCGRHELSETGEGKGGESETGEGESETGEGKGGESETGEGKGGEREKGESETGEGKGGESETGEGKGGESETGEKKGRKKRKQQQQQGLFPSPVRIYVPCVVSSTGRIATSKKRKEGSIISISDHGGCAPSTLENNSGPDLGI